MSDFSLFGLFTAGLACMIPFASAYTKPVGANPSGNPISEPGLNSLVPAGKPFEVTWSPTTQGTVTLVLLKGPSSDAEPLGVIAENIPNSGMYVWVPNTAIEPSANDQPDGYGIQLIVDATGQYQYTTQFGISNPSWKQGESWGNLGSSSSSAAASSTTSAANTPHPYAGSSTTSTGSGWSSTTGKASSHWTATVTSTKASSNGTSSSTASAVGTASTGWAPHNSTLVTPTKPMTVPSTLRTTHAPATITSAALSTSAEAPTSTAAAASTSSTAAPQTNGAAGGSAATSFLGFVVAAGVAMFAL